MKYVMFPANSQVIDDIIQRPCVHFYHWIHFHPRLLVLSSKLCLPSLLTAPYPSSPFTSYDAGFTTGSSADGHRTTSHCLPIPLPLSCTGGYGR